MDLRTALLTTRPLEPEDFASSYLA